MQNKARNTLKKNSPSRKVIPTVKEKPGENRHPYIVCIGASAGGLNAVSELVSQLHDRLNAALFVVLHLSKAAVVDVMVERIKRETRITCEIARDGTIIKRGHVYVAPPDAHLLVKKDKIIIGHGPSENRFRPSIDVLFRSAAAGYGTRAIGVILTGFLNDGTSGMWAIKQSGGHCIVQDPNEAEYPDMPLSVLETMEVDHCVSLKKMGEIIVEISGKTPSKGIIPPAEIVAESELSEKVATDLRETQKIGEKTIYSCPSCGGGLWQINNGRVKHYRCHIGHSFSEKDLVVRQSETIEHTLWVAVRMMEERKQLLIKMDRKHSEKGLKQLSNSCREQAEQLDQHITKLKHLLFAINRD